MQTKNSDGGLAKHNFERRIKKTLLVYHSYIKIGNYERMANDTLPDFHKPNGHIWKRIHDQIQRKSLEWLSWSRFMNISEFNKQRDKKKNI